MLHSRVTHQPVCLGQRIYPKCGTFSAKQSWENWDNQSPFWGRGSSERKRATAARTQGELSGQFKLETSNGTVDSLPSSEETSRPHRNWLGCRSRGWKNGGLQPWGPNSRLLLKSFHFSHKDFLYSHFSEVPPGKPSSSFNLQLPTQTVS